MYAWWNWSREWFISQSETPSSWHGVVSSMLWTCNLSSDNRESHQWGQSIYYIHFTYGSKWWQRIIRIETYIRKNGASHIETQKLDHHVIHISRIFGLMETDHPEMYSSTLWSILYRLNSMNKSIRVVLQTRKNTNSKDSKMVIKTQELASCAIDIRYWSDQFYKML